MTVDERRKYLNLVAPRYARAGRSERSALLTEMAAVTEMLVAEKQRLRMAMPRVRPSLKEHIAWLEHTLEELDGELGQMVQGSPLWRAQEDLLRGWRRLDW